tara:strand:+ start:164 stop:778 length:615 start_codon:yes stop_codon:yes gene_type:complete
MLSNLKKKILIQFFLVLALIVIVLVTYSKLENEKIQSIETSQISENQIEKTDATNVEEEKESIIKNVKYVSRGIDGSEFKIEAETGSMSEENTSIMLMKNVKAEIILKNQKKISLTSKMAKYNIINSNTNFYDNVNTKYLQNELKSKNLELNFDENMIYMFENTLKNHEDKSELQAKIIKFDVIKKKFEILSKKDDKIKFIKKN